MTSYKTVDISQAKLQIEQNESQQNLSVNLAEKSKMSDAWEAIQEGNVFRYADHAKAKSSLSNKLSRKICDNYLTNPIYDGKEFVFRRQQRKQRLAQAKAFQRYMLPPLKQKVVEAVDKTATTFIQQAGLNSRGGAARYVEVVNQTQTEEIPKEVEQQFTILNNSMTLNASSASIVPLNMQASESPNKLTESSLERH